MVPALSALQEHAIRRTLDAIVLKSSDQFLELIHLPRPSCVSEPLVSFEFATASATATLMIEVLEPGLVALGAGERAVRTLVVNEPDV